MAGKSNSAAPDRFAGEAGWTEEREARLRGMWAERLTCAEIAKALGGLSRNAVIGKARRLGLTPRERGRRPRKTATPQRARSRIARLLKGRINWQRRRLLVPPDRTRDLAAQPLDVLADQRCNLLQLTRRSCRWPLGEPATPDFYFCGARSLPRRPYCNTHWRMAYRPLETAQQKRQR